MILRKSKIITGLPFLFPIFALLTINTSGIIRTVAAYFDEAIACFSLVYIFCLFLTNKLDKTDKVIFLLTVALTGIGLLSNIHSGIERTAFAIIIDMVFLWKPIACFLAFKNLSYDVRDKVIRTAAPLAKATVVLLFALALLGQVVNIGVTGSTFFGFLKSFQFYFKNAYQAGWLTIVCLILLAASVKRLSAILPYYILGIINLFLSGASSMWCWVIMEVMLLIIMNEKRKLKIAYIALLGVLFIAINYAEFSEYFLNDIAPRSMLLNGAFDVANEHFPLGSGFATYGSEMANRYYSPIYIRNGWKNHWGLGIVDNQFINDNFFASIIGQFGWLGFALYLTVLFFIFKQINRLVLHKYERVAGLATFLTLMASMVGSATAKSVMGICAFAVLGVLVAKRQEDIASSIQPLPSSVPEQKKPTA